MKKVHENLEPAEFVRPESGLIEKLICTRSGLLPTEYCEETAKEIFLIGTEPRELCELCRYEAEQENVFIENLQYSVPTARLPAADLPEIDALLMDEVEIEADVPETGNPLLD